MGRADGMAHKRGIDAAAARPGQFLGGDDVVKAVAGNTAIFFRITQLQEADLGRFFI